MAAAWAAVLRRASASPWSQRPFPDLPPSLTPRSPHGEIIMTIMRTVTHTCAQRFTGYKVFHIHHLINSSQQPCEVGRAGGHVSICTDVETEAQRGSVTCLKPHSKSVAELGPEVRPRSCLQPRALCTDCAVLQEDPSPCPESQPHPSRAADPRQYRFPAAWPPAPTPTRQPCLLRLLPADGQPGAWPTPAALPAPVSCPGRGGWSLLSCFPE